MDGERAVGGQPTSMDFFRFQPSAIRRHMEAAGLRIEELVERGPYAPEVEHQSRRIYIFAQKPDFARDWEGFVGNST